MDREIAIKVSQMIDKELQRDSLTELCEYWEITIDDYYEFKECAFKYIDLQD